MVHHECELEKHIIDQLASAGWLVGTSGAYDRQRALYTEDVLGWLKESQPESWAKAERMYGREIATTIILDRLVKSLEKKDGGTVRVLRYGFPVAGAGMLLMSQAQPEDERNETVTRRYQANRLRVVSQLRYSENKTDELDLAFFINGIPVATVELKTDFTQSVEAAMAQYRKDRPPANEKTGLPEPLLTFKRGAVVHFAMSDSDIRMTTKLAGHATYFLPFNRGNNGAKGNPPGENNTYPVTYFWEQVLQKDNWLRIFHRFVISEKKEAQDAAGHTYFKENQLFPRFHQWECVTNVLAAVRLEGPGQPYLIQHSAGSGKTNTISWTAHELIRVRQKDGTPYFHSIIVVTDRMVLDKQLQDAIAQIEHQTGVVRAIDRESSPLPKSQQLAEAMLSGTPIIICTLQTFPYAQKLILNEQSLRERRFAVIIDEAHSSTGGSTADDLRYVLTGQSEEEWDALSKTERLSVWQSSRQRPNNASYFAFTATPKHSTLSLFGRPLEPAKPVSDENPPSPFHLYSMQQAIEEGFILDVLQNYTSYQVALRLGNAFVHGEDKRVDEKSAKRALAKWISLHPTNVAQKVAMIIEHFRKNVAHLLAGQAKAMIVTSSRPAAIKYHLELERYCQSHGYGDIQAIVAFSGEVSNKEVEEPSFPEEHAFSEGNMNPSLHGRDMRKAFVGREYRIMIVANKFQTGFDQPKLVAMYVDKKVSGVEAVQTFSRLNRTFPGKDQTFVIDFANKPEEILEAFRTFYRCAQVAHVQDPHVVYDLKDRLDTALLYQASEVEAFGNAIVDSAVTHQQLYALTQAPTDRYNSKMKALTDAIEQWERRWEQAKSQEDAAAMSHADANRAELCKDRDELLIFSEGLGKFAKTYEYIAQLVDFGDPQLEAFASFARLLRKRLKGVVSEQVDLGALKLTHYKIKRNGELSGIGNSQETHELYGVTDNGQRDPRDRQKKYLAELIERMNKVMGDGLSDEDRVAFAIHVSARLRGNELVMAQIRNNPKDQALRADLPAAMTNAISGALATHNAIATRLLQDPDSRKLFLDIVYDLLKGDHAQELLRELHDNQDQNCTD